MLALVLTTFLAAAATTDPIHVPAGQTITTTAGLGFGNLIYGGWFHAEDPSIAEVSGTVGVLGSNGLATITGLQQGETRLMLRFVSGLSQYRIPIGTIIVDPPCGAVTITIVPAPTQLVEGQTLRLAALTNGEPPITVAWYDGTRLLGVGPTLEVLLPRGTHRIAAEAFNRCGGAMTAPFDVVITAPRRRAAH